MKPADASHVSARMACSSASCMVRTTIYAPINVYAWADCSRGAYCSLLVQKSRFRVPPRSDSSQEGDRQILAGEWE